LVAEPDSKSDEYNGRPREAKREHGKRGRPNVRILAPEIKQYGTPREEANGIDRDSNAVADAHRKAPRRSRFASAQKTRSSVLMRQLRRR
jgi:hypothetical protein